MSAKPLVKAEARRCAVVRAPTASRSGRAKTATGPDVTNAPSRVRASAARRRQERVVTASLREARIWRPAGAPWSAAQSGGASLQAARRGRSGPGAGANAPSCARGGVRRKSGQAGGRRPEGRTFSKKRDAVASHDERRRPAGSSVMIRAATVTVRHRRTVRQAGLGGGVRAPTRKPFEKHSPDAASPSGAK